MASCLLSLSVSHLSVPPICLTCLRDVGFCLDVHWRDVVVRHQVHLKLKRKNNFSLKTSKRKTQGSFYTVVVVVVDDNLITLIKLSNKVFAETQTRNVLKNIEISVKDGQKQETGDSLIGSMSIN